jgi:hypothetical protein
MFVGVSDYFDWFLWVIVCCINVMDYLAYFLLLLHWLVSSVNIMTTKSDIVPSASLVNGLMTSLSWTGRIMFIGHDLSKYFLKEMVLNYFH